MIRKIILGASLVAVVACSSDNENTPLAPPVAENPLENKIVKIEEHNQDNLVRVWEFSYDKNHRLVRVTDRRKLSNENIETNFAYTGANSVVVTYGDNAIHSNLEKPTSLSVKLNDKKRATELIKTRYFKQDGENKLEENHFVYDTEQKQTQSQSSFFSEVKTQWKGKNIDRIEYKNSSKQVEYSQSFTYTDKVNKIYPDLNFFLSGFAIHSDLKYLFIDELGLRNHNLLQVAQFTHESNTKNQTFSYEFDQKQRPITITVEDKEQPSRKTNYRIYYTPGL